MVLVVGPRLGSRPWLGLEMVLALLVPLVVVNL